MYIVSCPYILCSMHTYISLLIRLELSARIYIVCACAGYILCVRVRVRVVHSIHMYTYIVYIICGPCNVILYFEY